MIKRVILLTTGALITINGIFVTFFTNFNLGVLLTDFLGLVLLLWGAYYKQISEVSKDGVFKYVKTFLKALILAEILFVSFLGIYGIRDNVTYKEDALIVLGAAVRGDSVSYPLKLRLDKAYEYHKKNSEVMIVVTGGMGAQESVTEAYAMEKYLIKKGVPVDKIIKEEKAASTNENMRFSKKLLDDCMKKDYKIAIVTNNFHIYRSVSMAKGVGFSDVSHIHAGVKLYNILPCYLRETLAILKMWVFD